STQPLENARSMLRALVPFYDQDRYFAPDIEKATGLVTSGDFNSLMRDGLLPGAFT
ncbi:MAG: histidine ammonia-lyase, partial [Deltaproteobacteria bacterium]|nr:histidine ammonia-lyase [Deltaproteobacteria bacterium]